MALRRRKVAGAWREERLAKITKNGSQLAPVFRPFTNVRFATAPGKPQNALSRPTSYTLSVAARNVGVPRCVRRGVSTSCQRYLCLREYLLAPAIVPTYDYVRYLLRSSFGVALAPKLRLAIQPAHSVLGVAARGPFAFCSSVADSYLLGLCARSLRRARAKAAAFTARRRIHAGIASPQSLRESGWFKKRFS